MFNDEWDQLVEDLRGESLYKLLEKRGIEILCSALDYSCEHKGRILGFDIILRGNNNKFIMINPSCSLKVKFVKMFIEKLDEFTDVSRYKNWKVYGAVGYLKATKASIQLAETKGLFIIKTDKDGHCQILNKENFQPKSFGV